MTVSENFNPRAPYGARLEMQDRCARYAEEIMVLRQQLEEVRHD